MAMSNAERQRRRRERVKQLLKELEELKKRIEKGELAV